MRLVITENQLDLKPFTLPLELVSDQFTNWSDLAKPKVYRKQFPKHIRGGIYTATLNRFETACETGLK